MSEDEQGSKMSVFADGEGKFEWLKHMRQRPGSITHMAAIPRATKSGKATVVILGKLKDGSYAVLETTLRLMQNAMQLWESTYGIESDGTGQPRLNDATRERLNVAFMMKLIKEREGEEVTYNIDELNRVMQDPSMSIEMQYGADGKSLTIRTKRGE